MNKILSHHIFKPEEVHQPTIKADYNSDSSVNTEKLKPVNSKIKKLELEVQDSSSESEEQQSSAYTTCHHLFRDILIT